MTKPIEGTSSGHMAMHMAQTCTITIHPRLSHLFPPRNRHVNKLRPNRAFPRTFLTENWVRLSLCDEFAYLVYHDYGCARDHLMLTQSESD